jgi:hypothetical protein
MNTTYKQYGGENGSKNTSKIVQPVLTKEGNSMIMNSKNKSENKSETKTEPKILVPECYTRGRCGPLFGFCDGNRFCNSEGKCGPGETHKPDVEHNNFKYRLCKGENDVGCVKTAICGADETHEIKCRLVFASLRI